MTDRKVWMVTGSSRGLGRAIVKGLLERGELVMEAVVCSVDGVQYIRQRSTAPPEQAAQLGERMAQLLADGGARNILEEVQRSRG